MVRDRESQWRLWGFRLNKMEERGETETQRLREREIYANVPVSSRFVCLTSHSHLIGGGG